TDRRQTVFQRQVESGFPREAPLHDDSISLLIEHGRKRCVELRHTSDSDRLDGNAERTAAILYELNETAREWTGCIGQDCHPTRGRQHLMDDLERFCSELCDRR